MRLAVSLMKCTLSLSLATVRNEVFYFFCIIFDFEFIHRILLHSHQVLSLEGWTSLHKVYTVRVMRERNSSRRSRAASLLWRFGTGGVQEADGGELLQHSEIFLCVCVCVVGGGTCSVGTGMNINTALYSHCRYNQRRRSVEYWSYYYLFFKTFLVLLCCE